MLFRILKETLTRRKKRVALAVLAVLIGSSLATALLTVSSEILDQFTKQMRSYGANILLMPESESLQLEIGGISYTPAGPQELINENDLAKLKTIFWRNNVTGFAPYLNVIANTESGEPIAVTGTWFEKELPLPKDALPIGEATSANAPSFKAGVKPISPWWQVKGTWVSDEDLDSAIVGTNIAAKMKLNVGDTLTIRYQERQQAFRVAGIVTTGGYEDDQMFVSLPAAQGLSGISHGASRVLVSALTMPKEKLAPDIRNKRPEDMTPAEYEKWYCSPIIDSIITQIKEVIPGIEAKPIRQISDAEGSFAMKIQLLVFIVTAVALLTSALGVMTTMTAAVMERQSEIGLMKAMGAENLQVATIFLAEAALIGFLGGALGYVAGYALANFIGIQVFNVPVVPSPFVLPISLLLATAVALLGSAIPVRRATQIQPINLLRGTGAAA